MEDKFFCINCKHMLPDSFTIAALEEQADGEDNYTYKYVENKIRSPILKNQRIGVVCPNCNEETFIASFWEANKKRKQEEEIIEVKKNPLGKFF